jgi:hypothetical protein
MAISITLSFFVRGNNDDMIILVIFKPSARKFLLKQFHASWYGRSLILITMIAKMADLNDDKGQ